MRFLPQTTKLIYSFVVSQFVLQIGMQMVHLQQDLPRLSGPILYLTSCVRQRIQNIVTNTVAHQLGSVESKVCAILFSFSYDHGMHIAKIFVIVG